MQISEIKLLADRIRTNVGQVIVGKEAVIDKMIIALITSGHILLEDVPGTGKTLLAKAMARSLECDFKRIQFTPDLLPSDLSGIQFYNQKQSEFEFRPGPLFTNILLADEINRATPRTQSSLLECMEERQVSVDGETRLLSNPFLVIATQNPIEHQGTFPLPEAQLDRFLFKISMGYPSTEEGMAILKRFKQEQPLAALTPAADAMQVVQAQELYTSVSIDDDLLNYLLQLVERTRQHKDIAVGVSPRGSQALLRAVQALAAISGRDYVVPEDIKYMALPVLAHRMVPVAVHRSKQKVSEQVLSELLNEISVPTESNLINR